MKIKKLLPKSFANIGLPIVFAITLALSSSPVSPAQAQTSPEDATIQQAQDNQTGGTVAQQTQNDASWLWWLLPLAALGILYLLLRRSVNSNEDEYDRYNYQDDLTVAGAKGGEVERDRDDLEDLDNDSDTNKSKADPWDHDQDDWNIKK